VFLISYVSNAFTTDPHDKAFIRYAFVEFEDPRDAEDALNDMHGRRIEGHTLTIQVRRIAVHMYAILLV
jgi:hypothetical protein